MQTIQEHKMIQQGDGIVVGVSGGPDSICLLHLLWRLKEAFQLSLYVVHLNHQLRGKEADEDADYVKDFSTQLGVQFFLYQKDVNQYSQEKGISLEEAGREIRYHLFYEVMKKTRATKISVAQNMNDQAETVLMRLFRGTGLEGLSAMDYVKDHHIIRPLLDINRKEIEDYCQAYDLKPRIDQTNLEPIYTRNRIRLELIPYIEKYFNPNLKATLCRTANLIREDKDFINSIVESIYDQIVKKTKTEIHINLKAFKKNHYSIQKRILRQSIRDISGDLTNVQNKHIEQLLNLIDKGHVGSAIDLPRKVTAVLSYENCIIRRKQIKENKFIFEYNVNIGESIDIKELNAYFLSEIIDIEDIKQISKEKYRKYFDFNKIENNLLVRNRRNGDHFLPLGMKGSKKLKDYFIDEKIPREWRDKIPLVCDGNQIMWVIGHRMSDKYKVDQHTKKVLSLSYKTKKVE